MAETRSQSFENHGQYRPEYHIVVFFILLANFLWAGYQLFQGLTGGAVVAFLMNLAVLGQFLPGRRPNPPRAGPGLPPEMRQRFRSVLAADIANRASALPLRQVIALRFASDEELPSLVSDVMSGQLTAPKDIKQKVRDWQADHLRA